MILPPNSTTLEGRWHGMRLCLLAGQLYSSWLAIKFLLHKRVYPILYACHTFIYSWIHSSFEEQIETWTWWAVAFVKVEHSPPRDMTCPFLRFSFGPWCYSSYFYFYPVQVALHAPFRESIDLSSIQFLTLLSWSCVRIFTISHSLCLSMSHPHPPPLFLYLFKTCPNKSNSNNTKGTNVS